MARTLADILTDANAFLDLNAAQPTGSELTTRSNYANQAVLEASAQAQFKEFKKLYVIGMTGATLPLPSGFREFMVQPNLLNSDGTWSEYGEINVEDIFKMGANDKYCYVTGNPAEGYTAVFNNLSSGCTLSIVYQRFPSGLLTLSDACELSDPQYVVSKVESLVLQSRRDERFPIKDAEAERKLRNMVGRGSKRPGGGVNTTPRQGQSNYVLE